MFGYSWKFIIGMALLLTNQVVGWGGIALCAFIAKKTGKKCYYAYGTAVYVLSWGMLIAGVFLAGPEGARIAKQLLRTYWWQTAAVAAIVIMGATFYVLRKKKKVPVPLSGQVE